MNDSLLVSEKIEKGTLRQRLMASQKNVLLASSLIDVPHDPSFDILGWETSCMASLDWNLEKCVEAVSSHL